MKSERPPPIEGRYRIPLRAGAAVASYLLYLGLFGDRMVAGGFVGFGVMITAWVVIDRLTLWRRDRVALLDAGFTILGLVLIAVGAYLALR